jgi:hypothetical protein
MASTYRQELINQFGFEPPHDYLAYLLTAESTHQFGGAYLVEDDELLAYNADHEADEFYPGYFLIGSDGGGEAFAIEKVTGIFFQLPFIGHEEETATIIGRTWSEFLDYLLTEYA